MKNFGLFLFGLLIGGAIVYFLCCKPTTVAETLIPKGIITPAQATILDTTFNSRHLLISDAIVKRPDNRSSWYSLNDMRDYLTYAEHQADSLQYTMDGIRVYLGAHADVSETVGYTTMFFIPTGTPNKQEASMLNLSLATSKDIPGAYGLNEGGLGNPPSANYPQ